MIRQMSLSHAEFGMVYSASMFSLILFRIPWGLIADRVGYLWTLKLALLITAASALARGFAVGNATANATALGVTPLLAAYG